MNYKQKVEKKRGNGRFSTSKEKKVLSIINAEVLYTNIHFDDVLPRSKNKKKKKKSER